jgi:hypothetical protein
MARDWDKSQKDIAAEAALQAKFNTNLLNWRMAHEMAYLPELLGGARQMMVDEYNRPQAIGTSSRFQPTGLVNRQRYSPEDYRLDVTVDEVDRGDDEEIVDETVGPLGPVILAPGGGDPPPDGGNEFVVRPDFKFLNDDILKYLSTLNLNPNVDLNGLAGLVISGMGEGDSPNDWIYKLGDIFSSMGGVDNLRGPIDSEVVPGGADFVGTGIGASGRPTFENTFNPLEYAQGRLPGALGTAPLKPFENLFDEDLYSQGRPPGTVGTAPLVKLDEIFKGTGIGASGDLRTQTTSGFDGIVPKSLAQWGRDDLAQLSEGMRGGYVEPLVTPQEEIFTGTGLGGSGRPGQGSYEAPFMNPLVDPPGTEFIPYGADRFAGEYSRGYSTPDVTVSGGLVGGGGGAPNANQSRAMAIGKLIDMGIDPDAIDRLLSGGSLEGDGVAPTLSSVLGG